MKKISLLFIGLLFLGFSSCKMDSQSKAGDQSQLDSLFFIHHFFHYQSTPSIEVDQAAVVSAHPIASDVGIRILKEGGNAIDAAIAVQYALAVVYPGAGNIGGGGFMLIHTAEGERTSIDFRETAPAAAHRDMYLDKNGEVVPRKSLDGALAVGVPGTVAGADLAHQKYGNLSMRRLIEPAILLAELGFAITSSEAKYLNENAEAFKKFNPEGTAFVREMEWQAGDTLVQPELAATLKRISEKGSKDFYEGETARLIVEEMERSGGLITAEDLKNYRPIEREPRVFDYKGATIETMDLPSSGGLMLEMMLKMLAPYDLAEMGFHSAEAINHVVEVERRAYADRTDYMGDPDFVKVPVKALTDDAYLLSRMKDFVPGEAGNSEEITSGLKESEQTTHLSILDAEGNAVAVTTTLNTHYGSNLVVDGAGFLLNNEMDDFSSKPGVPNEYGLLGTEANKIEAHKRPVSSMMPTIIVKDDKPYMVVGTPGGSTIITSVLQSILNVMEFGLSAEEAVNAPKFHHQWQPDVIYIEENFPAKVRLELETMGYTLKERGPIGRTEMILVEDGKIKAAADKRGDDSASGY